MQNIAEEDEVWAVYRSRLQKHEEERTGQLREVAEVLDATVSGEDGSGDSER